MASSNAATQYGITKPISLAGPVEADLHKTAELMKFLVEADLYESAEESARREEVLLELDKIVNDWVKQLTSQRGYTDQMVEQANAVRFTFGSHRLGELEVEKFITHSVPFSEINTAFDLMLKGESLRCIMRMEE